MNDNLSILVHEHLHDDVQKLALQHNRFPQLTDTDFHFLLQQIEGRQRTKDKLPYFAQIADWWYPVRLSCEQCSSEATARYKAQLLSAISYHPSRFIDLTGGYGVDTYFLSEHVQEAHYVERNTDLCTIAAHNFSLQRPQIHIHNTTAEEFLAQHSPSNREISDTLLFVDPARRSQTGSKVFRIEDCEPNIIHLLPTLRKHATAILIKFSPMLDIVDALRRLEGKWDVHIVAINNEVKEVLLISAIRSISTRYQFGKICAINILPTQNKQYSFYFDIAEEKNAHSILASSMGQYLYEPNAAIIKAGAFRLIGERFHLAKLDTNTHLYTSDTLIHDFPGRVWEIIDTHLSKTSTLNTKLKYCIISRNYPLTPEQMRKKYKLADGDDYYLIGARHLGKPTLMLCLRKF